MQDLPNHNQRPLPAGWSQHHDQRGTCYYVNTNTMPPQVSYTHPADDLLNTTGPSSSQTPQAFSQKSLAQQLYASSVNAAIGSSPRASIHGGVLQPSMVPLSGNPISPPMSTNVPPSRESSYGLPQSTLGPLPTFSSTGVGSSSGSGLMTHNPPVQSRHYSSPGIGVPHQHGSHSQSTNPLLPGQQSRHNTMPSVTLVARPPSQVYFDHPPTRSPPLIAPRPQLPPGSHNIELPPTLSDTHSPPFSPFSPQMNQVTSPVISPQSFAAYQLQSPPKTNAQMTTELATRKAKEGAQQTVKALKKMGKASKNAGKAALKMGGAMLTSPAAGAVANSVMNPNAATTLINAFTTMQRDEEGFNFTDLQAVMQGQPDADYQSILSALSAQQQLMQMQSTTSTAQAPPVDYQSVIAEVRRIQQISAQQQAQAQANMASAISQAQAQASAQQNTAASLQNTHLQNMYLQTLQAQVTAAHRPLTQAALYQNLVQSQAMQNGDSNNALAGGPYTNMQVQGTSQANGVPLRPNSNSQNPQAQVPPMAAPQGNATSLHQNAFDIHSQVSGTTTLQPQVLSQPPVPENGQPIMNSNNTALNPQDVQHLMQVFLKLQQQQQMSNTANSSSQQTQMHQVQLLLQAYQEHLAPLLQSPAQTSQPATPSNIPNSGMQEYIPNQTQQLHAQQSPQSPHFQQQHPQRPPSISQGMPNQGVQYPTSPSSVAGQYHASPSVHQQQPGSRGAPTPMHHSPIPSASSHSSGSPLGVQRQSPVPSGSTQVPQRQPIPSRRVTTPQTSPSPRGPRSHPRTLPPPPYISPEIATFPAEKLSMRTQSHPPSAEDSSSSSSQSGPSSSGSGSRQSLHPITGAPGPVRTGTAQSTVHEALNPMSHAHTVHSPEPHSSVHQPLNPMPNPQTAITINSQSSVQTPLNPIPGSQTVAPNSPACPANGQGQSFSNVSDAFTPMPEPPPPSYDTPGRPHIPAPPPPPPSQQVNLHDQGQIAAPPPPQYNQPTLPIPQSPVQASNPSISPHQYQVPPPPPLENTGTSPTPHHAQHSPSIPHPGSQHSSTIQNATQSTQQSSFPSTSQSLTHQQMQSLIDAYHQAQEAPQAPPTSPPPQSQYQPISAPVQQLPSVQSPPVSPAANGGQHVINAHTPVQHQQPVYGGVLQSPTSQTHYPHTQYVQSHVQAPYQASTNVGPQTPPIPGQQPQAAQTHASSQVQTAYQANGNVAPQSPPNLVQQPQAAQVYTPSHVQAPYQANGIVAPQSPPILGQQPQTGQGYTPSHVQAPYQANGNGAPQRPPIPGQQPQGEQPHAPSHVQTPYQVNGNVAPQNPPTPGQQSQTAQSPAAFNTHLGVQRPPIPGQVQQSPNVQGHLQMQPPPTMTAGVQRPPLWPPQGPQQQNVHTSAQIPHHLSMNPAQVQQSLNGPGSVQAPQGLNMNGGVQRPPLSPPAGQVSQLPDATSALPVSQPLGANAGVHGSPLRPPTAQVQQPMNAPGLLPAPQSMNMNTGVQRPPLRPQLQNQQSQNAQGPVVYQQQIAQTQQQWPPKPPLQMLPQQSALQQQNMSSAGQQQGTMQNLLHMMSNLGLQQPQQLQQKPPQAPHPYSHQQQPDLNSSGFMSQLQHFIWPTAHQDPSSPSHVQQHSQSNNATSSQEIYHGQGMVHHSDLHQQEAQTQSGQYDGMTIQTTYEQVDGVGHSQQEMEFTFDTSYQQFDTAGQGQQGMSSLAQQDSSVSPQGYQQTQIQSSESVYQSQGQQQGTLDVLQTYQQGQDMQSWSVGATWQQQDLQGFTDTTSAYQSQGQQQGTLDVLQTYQQGQDMQSWSLDVTLQQQDSQGSTDTTFSGSFSESYEASC